MKYTQINKKDKEKNKKGARENLGRATKDEKQIISRFHSKWNR